MKIKHITDTLLRLVFPPRCAVCDDVLPFTNYGELCSDCASEIDTDRKAVCNICRKGIDECVCSVLDDGQTPISLMFYMRDANRAAEKMVFGLKECKTSTAYRFFARELSRKILLTLAKSGEQATSYLVTYTPRSEAKLKRYGFDQGERLAKAIAEYTGMKLEIMFVRSSSREQKKLSAVERKANATTLSLSDVTVTGKRIFVIDDIITTGATMNAAVKLLSEAGAENVRVASVFRSMKSKPKHKEKANNKEPLWFEE